MYHAFTESMVRFVFINICGNEGVYVVVVLLKQQIRYDFGMFFRSAFINIVTMSNM